MGVRGLGFPGWGGVKETDGGAGWAGLVGLANWAKRPSGEREGLLLSFSFSFDFSFVYYLLLLSVYILINLVL